MKNVSRQAFCLLSNKFSAGVRGYNLPFHNKQFKVSMSYKSHFYYRTLDGTFNILIMITNKQFSQVESFKTYLQTHYLATRPEMTSVPPRRFENDKRFPLNKTRHNRRHRRTVQRRSCIFYSSATHNVKGSCDDQAIALSL